MAQAIIAADDKRDVILIQFDARDTPYVRLGDSSAVKVGDKVVAIGAPLGLENTVSDGIVSNPERLMGNEKFIQFTAPISPGNSGGALFARNGRVIGVTAAAILGTTEEPGHNLNLAVPINVVHDSVSGKEGSMTTGSPAYYYWLGGLEEDKHNWDRALEYYQKAVALDENFGDAYVAIGGMYFEKGNYAAELNYYKKAVALEPDDYETISLLASAYEDTGDYARAIELYKKALDLKPDDKESLFDLAFLSVLTGDLATARELTPSLAELDGGKAKEIEALVEFASSRSTRTH